MKNVEAAIHKGFKALTSGKGEEAKKALIEEMFKDDDYRNIVFALIGIASGELTEGLKKLGITQDPENWGTMTSEDRRKYIEDLAPKVATPGNMKHGLDLVWLGVCIGMALETRAKVMDQAEDMIMQVLKDTDYGRGSCALCSAHRHLKKWGPNGEPICAECAEKHPEGILTVINKTLRERFGPDAPQAIHAGVLGGENMDQVQSEVWEAMKAAKETDITKFN